MIRGFVVIWPDQTWALVIGGEVTRVGIVGELPNGWQSRPSSAHGAYSTRRGLGGARSQMSMRRSRRLGFNAYRGGK
jgi:hypothetical protein